MTSNMSSRSRFVIVGCAGISPTSGFPLVSHALHALVLVPAVETSLALTSPPERTGSVADGLLLHRMRLRSPPPA